MGSIIALLAVVWVTTASAAFQEVKSGEFSEPRGDAESMQVNLVSLVAGVTVGALDDSTNLIEADVEYLGNIEFAVDGETDKIISLTETGFNNFNVVRGRGLDLTWNVGLRGDVPLDLRVETGPGNSELNLANLELTRLDFETASGNADMFFPATEESFILNSEAGSGGVVATLPDEGRIDLAIEAGSGSFELTAGDSATINAANVEIGSGEFALMTGANADVTISSTDIGSGNFTVSAGDKSIVNALIDAGAGEVTLNLGDVSALSGSVRVGSGSISLTLGETSDAQMILSSGSGSIDVDVPDDAPIRLEFTGNRRSSLTTPPELEQLSGDDHSGVWQTDDYETAEIRTLITVDVASGDVTIR